MIHLCIYAVATIAKDTEVTIAFDYEYNIWWVLHLARELSTALQDWTSSSSPFLAFYILLRFLLNCIFRLFCPVLLAYSTIEAIR